MIAFQTLENAMIITYIIMAVLTVCIMHGVYLLVKDAEVRFRQRREMNKDATNNK